MATAVPVPVSTRRDQHAADRWDHGGSEQAHYSHADTRGHAQLVGQGTDNGEEPTLVASEG